VDSITHISLPVARDHGPRYGPASGDRGQGAPADTRVVTALNTRLTKLLGIRYPIIQTGMGWVANARLTAATSKAGGLGILGSATMTLDEVRRSLDEIRSLTDAPFGVNFRSDNPDVDHVVDLLIERRVRVASYGGAPRRDLVEKLKAAGIVNLPTVGALRHAQKVVEWGVDAVMVQGAEGGGHTGKVPTSLLVPQVVDAVKLPVIAAGGYFDGRGLVSALAYGGEGIAMGTRFLLTQESPVHEAIKSLYLKQTVDDTVVTCSIDGAPQRVVRTLTVAGLERGPAVVRLGRAAWTGFRSQHVTKAAFVRRSFAIKRFRDQTWAQMIMAPNAPILTRASLIEGDTDPGVFPVGQVVGLIRDLPTVAELIHRIMHEAATTIGQLSSVECEHRQV
jgi:NAD(P)H-dependent flavin oxidoreductase YrpB (nitropropane dioxygenase family)